MKVVELENIYDEVARCNRCGWCQSVCPIYKTSGVESFVARGHNTRVRNVVEGRIDFNNEMKDYLYECLLCKSCVANCFPAVKTDEIVTAARSAYLNRYGQSEIRRFIFHELLPDLKKLAFYVRLVSLGKKSGISALARELGILKWFGKDLSKAEKLISKLPFHFLSERIEQLNLTDSKNKPRGDNKRVAYFISCGFNFALPEVGEAALRVLKKNDCSVIVAENNCCGLPPFSYGDFRVAQKLARKNLNKFKDLNFDVLVSDCASCSSFLKDYSKLLVDDPEYSELALNFSKKVMGFSEFINVTGIRPSDRKLEGIVTYHDPCHMSRYQNLTDPPRKLIKSINGVEYRELPEASWCCGSAGTYNLTHFERSMNILRRKLENIRKTKANIVVTECPSCIIQLSFGIKENTLPVEVIHIAQLLDRAYQ